MPSITYNTGDYINHNLVDDKMVVNTVRTHDGIEWNRDTNPPWGAYESWMIRGKYHNVFGLPAVKYDSGYTCHQHMNEYHCENGPAIIDPEAITEDLYYYYGKEINVSSDEEYKRYIKLLVFS